MMTPEPLDIGNVAVGEYQGYFLVAEERCDQCLFTPERIVSSRRMAEVLAATDKADTFFICHRYTIDAGDGPDNVCCRGFYDRDPRRTNLMRIADRLGVVRTVPLPPKCD